MSKEIERIERKIKSAENQAGGDKDELEHQFNKLSKEVMKIDIKFKAGLEIFMAMDSSLSSRQQSFTRLKEQIVNITSNDFLRYRRREPLTLPPITCHITTVTYPPPSLSLSSPLKVHEEKAAPR